MPEIKLELDTLNTGAFNMYSGSQKVGTLMLNIDDGTLMAFHTEVEQKSRGKGYAKKLFDEMVTYAQAQHLKVVPLCPYIRSHFKKNPEKYNSLWKKIRIKP